MKRMLKILAAIFAVLVLAALAAPFFISADTLKAQFIAQVEKATGRKVTIGGATSLTLFPNIAVSAEDVTIGNPAGFSTPHLIHAGKLATGAQLGPLLKGNLLIDGITIDKADVNLEELKSGGKNWVFTKEKLQEEAAEEVEKEKKSPIKSFALGDITISDSRIAMIRPGEKILVLNDIDLTVKGADAHAPLAVDGAADFNKERVSVSLDIQELDDFLEEKDSPLSAEFDLPGGRVHFNGKGSMKNGMSATGKLDASVASLPKLMGWASGKKPQGALPENLSAKGNFVMNGKRYALSDARFSMDDIQAAGQLGADLSGATPTVNGKLKLGALNLDRFMKKPVTETGGSSGGGSSKGWSNHPINLSGLKTVNASLDLAADSVTSGKLQLGPTDLGVALNGGALKLNIKKTSLYGGSMHGIVNANANAGQSVGADLTMSNINVEQLMIALNGASKLRGTLNGTLDLKGSGSSEHAIVSSLNGNGKLKVTDGAIKGVNLAQFLREAKKGFLFDSDQKSTDFSELGASFTVSKGILSNNDLAMKAPLLRLTGSGTANLPAQTLNYKLLPTLSATSKGQGGRDVAATGLTVPLLVTGSWSNPSVTPDVRGLVEEGLKDPAALKENLKGLKEGFKDLNSPSDIGKALLGGSKTETVPATSATPVTETAPAPAPANEQKPEDMLKEGLGNLLKGF